jgi:hypothetical protein
MRDAGETTSLVREVAEGLGWLYDYQTRCDGLPSLWVGLPCPDAMMVWPEECRPDDDDRFDAVMFVAFASYAKSALVDRGWECHRSPAKEDKQNFVIFYKGHILTEVFETSEITYMDNDPVSEALAILQAVREALNAENGG